MRKVALVLLSAVFLATLFGCGQGEDVLFQVENVERIEAYRYDGVPAAAEKKIITDPNEIKISASSFFLLEDRSRGDFSGRNCHQFSGAVER